jgi:periplasmic protein TonB
MVSGPLDEQSLKEVAAMVSQSLPLAIINPGGNRKPNTTPPVHKPQAQVDDTFLKAMLELPSQHERRNLLEWLFSLIFHAALIAALIITPLYFTQAIDLKALENTWLVVPPPPAPPPPAAPAVRVVRPVARLIQAGKLMAPTVIPKQVTIIKEAPLPPDSDGGVVGGVPGGIPGGQVGGVLGGILGGTAGPANAGPPPPVKRILRVGGNVKAPRRTFAPEMQYPFLAKQAKIQGDVVIDAVIDEQGDVVQAHVMSGPALLVPAALDTVTKWKYEPSYLDGSPVSVEMHVVVHFTLQ